MRHKQSLSDKEVAHIEAMRRLSELKLNMANQALERLVRAERRELAHLEMASALLTLKGELGVSWLGLKESLNTSLSVDTLKSVGLRRRSLSKGVFADLCNKVWSLEVKNSLKCSLVKPWEDK